MDEATWDEVEETDEDGLPTIDDVTERWLRGEDVSDLDVWAEWAEKYADEDEEDA